MNRNSYSVPPSLRNTGANCYLNSALQGISSCDKFVKELGQLQKKYKEMDLPKLKILIQLIIQLSGTSEEKRSYEISRNPIFKEWNKPGQQDSFELLSYMMNQVYQEIRTKLIKSEKLEKSDIPMWLKETLPLRLILQYKMKCQHCDKEIETPKQCDLAFHLFFRDDKKCYKIEEMLKDYFSEDKVIGYKCDNCSEENVMKTIILIEPPPETICIHLQRNKWRFSSMLKIDNKVTFEESLILESNYFVDKSFQWEYNLKSVIVHSGSVYFGHYICYKNVDSLWFQTNDSYISKTNWYRVKSCQPYILFYELSKKAKIASV